MGNTGHHFLKQFYIFWCIFSSFCVKFYVSFCRRLCLCGNSGPQIILRICATLFCGQAISLSCIPLYHTDAAHKLNMPVHHLVVACPPPIHQPVLFFQLLPPGVQSESSAQISTYRCHTNTLDCIHELPVVSIFASCTAAPSTGSFVQNIHDPSSTRPNQLSPPFLCF